MNPLLLAAVDTNHIQTAIAPLLVILIPLIIIVAIWDAVWRLIAFWKSARHGQLAWFICLAIFNTAGILPILYILLFQRKREAAA